MQEAFGTVVVVVCAVAAVGALVALLLNGRTWDDYRASHLLFEREAPRAGGTSGASERDAEIRELIEARNALRRRRGEPEVDLQSELARLAQPPEIDDELRGEIRDLVIARNHRRARQGKPPLDVEAEIAREIAGLPGV
jgi:hypothetical protein